MPLYGPAERDEEFGKIWEKLKLRPQETEFEHGIRQFGYLLLEVTLALVFLIFAVNVYFHRPVLEAFPFSGSGGGLNTTTAARYYQYQSGSWRQGLAHICSS